MVDDIKYCGYATNQYYYCCHINVQYVKVMASMESFKTLNIAIHYLHTADLHVFFFYFFCACLYKDHACLYLQRVSLCVEVEERQRKRGQVAAFSLG